MAEALGDAFVQVRTAMTSLTSAQNILNATAPTDQHPGATRDAVQKAILAVRNLGDTLKSHPAAPKNLGAWP